MTSAGWEPATPIEHAMRDALRTGNQEHYFRLLADVELLLPMSAEALAGRGALGWGTWTTSGRTHVLAFTSAGALHACLGQYAGPYRATSYADLASSWPNPEWWLAVDPGLPIEAYLPAWFVHDVAGRGAQPEAHPAPPPITQPPPEPKPEFVPANRIEHELLAAAGNGDTDAFLGALLPGKVVLPMPANTPDDLTPEDPFFPWHTEILDGETYLTVFTSLRRLLDWHGTECKPVPIPLVQLVQRWPDETWSFAINPGSPISATLPGSQVIALAAWAAAVGLAPSVPSPPPKRGYAAQHSTPSGATVVPTFPGPRVEPTVVASTTTTGATPAVAGTRVPEPRPEPTGFPAVEVRADGVPTSLEKASTAGEPPAMLGKVLLPLQVRHYLERGYDRVAGYVHAYDSAEWPDYDLEAHVLRWPAQRRALYQPTGAESGIGRATVEIRVDSVRLPHGAELWQIGATGRVLMARFDADAQRWLPVAVPREQEPAMTGSA